MHDTRSDSDTKHLGSGLADPSSSSKPVLVGHVVSGGSSGIELVTRILFHPLLVVTTVVVLLFLLRSFFLFLRCCIGLVVSLRSRARVISGLRFVGRLGRRAAVCWLSACGYHKGILRGSVWPDPCANGEAATAYFHCHTNMSDGPMDGQRACVLAGGCWVVRTSDMSG